MLQRPRAINSIVALTGPAERSLAELLRKDIIICNTDVFKKGSGSYGAGPGIPRSGKGVRYRMTLERTGLGRDLLELRREWLRVWFTERFLEVDPHAVLLVYVFK